MIQVQGNFKKESDLIFLSIFHLLNHGLMTKFKTFKNQYMFLNLKSNPKKHLTKNKEWGMVDFTHDANLKNKNTVMQEFILFFLNVDEMMTINN
jgi:hypothetical protein